MSTFNSPRELLNAYRDGFEGSICDPEETAELLAELKTPLFGATAYKLYGSGEGKLSLPFKSLMKFDLIIHICLLPHWQFPKGTT